MICGALYWSISVNAPEIASVLEVMQDVRVADRRGATNAQLHLTGVTMLGKGTKEGTGLCGLHVDAIFLLSEVCKATRWMYAWHSYVRMNRNHVKEYGFCPVRSLGLPKHTLCPHAAETCFRKTPQKK